MVGVATQSVCAASFTMSRNSEVLEDEVLPGMESADQPTEEMSERHDHSRNYIGKVRIELCAKSSFILQVYDVLARHS
jgi:hypothetical protein